MRTTAVCIGILALTFSRLLSAQDPSPPYAFDLPMFQAGQRGESRRVVELIRKEDYAAAEALLTRSIERTPHNFDSHYNLACVLALQGKTEAALKSLATAVERGYRDRPHMESDPDLQSLRDSDKFDELLKQAEIPWTPPESWRYDVEPAVAADGEVLISDKNVVWRAEVNMFQVLVKVPASEPPLPIAKGLGEAGELLRRWHDDGTAAGNQGDLYDNHDSDHSNMNYAALPQLTRVEFAEEAKQRQLHHGAQLAFLYDAPTIGNSSTAVTSGPFWRSQPRLILTRPLGAAKLHLQYRANQLYFYPEHRDHDPGHHDPGHNGTGDGYGDVYPANTPYMIVSQGSSGSDRPFMNAVAQTMAAFRPEVKAKLVEAGMLMPAIQMIFRSCNRQVVEPADYLSGKAHPTVFEGSQIDVVKMVTMAHDMQPDSLPPLAELQVQEEDEPIVGRDYFDVGPREQMFDTPCAIARVVKSSKYLRRMVVSAEASKDLNGNPLTYHWEILRGDPEKITINKLNEAGSIVELLIGYHERRPIANGQAMESNRVDIGAFVHNGDYYSPPALISLMYLDNEQREYDDQQRIVSVDYAAETTRNNYVDPLIDIRKDWRDEYHYADDGTLSGWTRIRGESKQEFNAQGELLVEAATGDAPSRYAPVRYVPRQQGNQPPTLTWEIAEERP